jgi:Rrf2 family transcriptional regulator, cysteine metabolism repressor
VRISSKGDYGLRALFDLAQHFGHGPVQSEAIAQRQGIPVNYLNQLLITMRRAGLISSTRGPQGGHELAQPPSRIRLIEVLQVLEGPLLVQEAGRDNGSQAVDDRAVIDEFWQELRAALIARLSDVTLEDLLQRKLARRAAFNFDI